MPSLPRITHCTRHTLWLLGGFGLALLLLLAAGLLEAFPNRSASSRTINGQSIDLSADSAEIRIRTDIEGAQRLPVHRIAKGHYLIDMTNAHCGNWFLARVEGAAGSTIRIDVKQKGVRAGWAKLNPVYSYIERLDDPRSFISSLSHDGPLTEANNGAFLPSTALQMWHFVPNCTFQGDRLSFIHKFEKSPAYVALKYPLTPSLDERLLQRIAANPHCRVHEIGKSAGGRPLRVVEIGGTPGGAMAKPGVVMYAREFANQQDTAWAAHGAIECLLSDAPDAVQARNAVTYLIIPLMDPDGAAIGEYTGVGESFGFSPEDRPETNAFVLFFKKWVRAGNRIDLVVNLHNTESIRPVHLFMHRIDNGTDRSRYISGFHDTVRNEIGNTYVVHPTSISAGPMPFKLGWHLSDRFGTLDLFYEINSQSPAVHLTLAQVKDIGARISVVAQHYIVSAEGREWSKEAHAVREDWLHR